MKFFAESLKTMLATRWRGWLLVLLAPLLILCARRVLPAADTAAPVQVGVVLPAQGGQAFWARLEARGGGAADFCLAEEEEARRQVASGRWDCALLLPADFDERLARRDTARLITLLISPGSTAYPMVRETAAACLVELVSPGVAESYLLSSGIADRDTVAAMRPRLRETLGEAERVQVTMQTLSGRPLSAPELAADGMENLLAGLLAILLLVYALFAAIDLGRWLDTPFARRLLPLRGPLALLLPRLAGAMLPALCAGLLALGAAGSAGRCLLPLLVYLLFLASLALALARCRALCSALPVLMPFVPAAGLLLSPVLADLSPFFPALAPVMRWAPVTLFLRGCAGHWQATLTLAAAAAALLGLLCAAAAGRKQKSNHRSTNILIDKPPAGPYNKTR